MKTDYRFTMTLTENEVETIQEVYQACADRSLTAAQVFDVFRNMTDGLGADNLACIELPFNVTIEKEIPEDDA